MVLNIFFVAATKYYIIPWHRAFMKLVENNFKHKILYLGKLLIKYKAK